MGSVGVDRRLRLKRMAAESILREKILPKEGLDRETIAVVAEQLKGIVEAMEAEWADSPASGELKDAFRLLFDYIDCLEVGPRRLISGLS